MVGTMDDADHDAEEDAARGNAVAQALHEANNWEPAKPEHIVGLTNDQFDDMERAADYSDEWCVSSGQPGPTALRVFYVCNRKINAEDRCNTLIASSQWRRKIDDPCATKQAW